jgi:predicted nucleic acid-binding protein
MQGLVAALRRDEPEPASQVIALKLPSQNGELIVATGLVFQELLQGFSWPKAREQILEHFSALPLLTPDRGDHVEVASIRNRCRHRGIQIGTVDALLAQLCIHHNLVMLSSDRDVQRVAKHSNLRLWTG